MSSQTVKHPTPSVLGILGVNDLTRLYLQGKILFASVKSSPATVHRTVASRWFASDYNNSKDLHSSWNGDLCWVV